MSNFKYKINIIITALFLSFSMISYLQIFTVNNHIVEAAVTASDVKAFDIRTKNSKAVTAEKIDSYLKNGWGKGLGKTFMSASKKYGVNAAWAVGQLQAENGITGPAPNGSLKNDNNPSGMKCTASEVGKNGVVGLDGAMVDGTGGAYCKFDSLATGLDFHFKKLSAWMNGKAPSTSLVPETSVTNSYKFALKWTGVPASAEKYMGIIAKVFNTLGQDAGKGKADLMSGDGADDPDAEVEGSNAAPDWNPFMLSNYQEQGNQTGVQNKGDLVSDDAIVKLDNFLQQHKALVITIQLVFTLVIILTIIFAIMGQYILVPGMFGYKLYEKIFNFQLEYGTRKLVWITAFTVIFLLACVWSNLYLYAMAWLVKFISMVMQMLHLA